MQWLPGMKNSASCFTSACAHSNQVGIHPIERMVACNGLLYWTTPPVKVTRVMAAKQSYVRHVPSGGPQRVSPCPILSRTTQSHDFR